MLIEVTCPACQAKLRVAEKNLGQRLRCPKCRAVVEVPSATTTVDAGPAAEYLRGEAEVPLGETRVLDRGALAASASEDAAIISKFDSDPAPKTLRGYELIKELGRGGMGRVFLARQKSLDRLVALKVMNPQRARDPAFLARFMREAYAAAQLVHHHIVQIYDIGAEHGCHYFTMEYVRGRSLADIVERDGKLDPEVAVGYLLQAARGLKFGHDLGMVHRDVKPDNILVNDQGIVKVADLGLVKLPQTEEIPLAASADEPDVARRSTMVTRVGVGVGTPAFMAPEQARDAAHVDRRADIYSLGCTLYYLVTGKPPFEGKTALEVLSKHQNASYIPPDEIVKRVPKALTAILNRMLAKRPEDRFADMKEVIAAFEKFLGVQQTGAFTPQEEHATVLEQCVKAFNEAPLARRRSWFTGGFFGGCAALVVVSLLAGGLGIAGAVLGLAILTPAALFLIHGWRERSYLFLKVREFVLDARPTELLYGCGVAALLALLLYLFNLHWLWLFMAVVGCGLALAYYLLVDRRLAAQRRPAVERVEKLLRKMRLGGLEEKALERFVCKYAGRDWEEFYETLFGYEAKLKARHWLRGEAAERRNTYAAWRDPLIQWLEAKQRARKEAREKKQLEAIEAQALQARGVAAAEAHEKAAQVAEAMVAQAAAVAEVMDVDRGAAAAAVPVAQFAEGPPGSSESAPQVSFQKLLETAQNPETTVAFQPPRRRWRFPVGRVVRFFVGGQFRFVVGMVLVIMCLTWLRQNELLEGARFLAALRNLWDTEAPGSWDQLAQPLRFPLLPAAWLARFNSLNPALAGLLLALSAFLGGWRVSLWAWPAALLMLCGGAWIPDVGPISGSIIGLAAGVGLTGLVWLVRRRRAAPAPSPPSPPTSDGDADP
ncbi:MAG: protein kinase [Gemmataceae bacterium]|nr:protein kinase [Gemmataceae bacterium]